SGFVLAAARREDISYPVALRAVGERDAEAALGAKCIDGRPVHPAGSPSGVDDDGKPRHPSRDTAGDMVRDATIEASQPAWHRHLNPSTGRIVVCSRAR